MHWLGTKSWGFVDGSTFYYVVSCRHNYVSIVVSSCKPTVLARPFATNIYISVNTPTNSALFYLEPFVYLERFVRSTWTFRMSVFWATTLWHGWPAMAQLAWPFPQGPFDPQSENDDSTFWVLPNRFKRLCMRYARQCSELRSCMTVEVAVLGSRP